MTELFESLLTPFHYDYMVKAIWVSALIGGVCAFLSCFVTLKGWSLMGDALVARGRARRGGGVYPRAAVRARAPSSPACSPRAAWASSRRRRRLREDAVIGIVFTTFFALGLLLISLFPARVDLNVIVFGNILGISDPDIWQVIVITAVTLVVLGAEVARPDAVLLRSATRPARSASTSRLLHLTLLTLLAATAVAALQTVGACLVVAMLVTPGRDRLPAHRPLRARCSWFPSVMGVGDLAGRGLCELLFRRLDRRLHRHLADAALPRRVRFRAQTRHARVQTPRCNALNAAAIAMNDFFEPLAVRLHARRAARRRRGRGVCAVLSCFLVLKGWSLMGDAISHAVLPGIVHRLHRRAAAGDRRVRRRACSARWPRASSKRTAGSRRTP